MATRLSELGVPVKLAIGLDPTSHMTASGHVDRYVNYYIANEFGDPVEKGRQFSGVLQNVDLKHMRGVNHFNIDKDRAVQGMVIRDIQAALPIHRTTLSTHLGKRGKVRRCPSEETFTIRPRSLTIMRGSSLDWLPMAPPSGIK